MTKKLKLQNISIGNHIVITFLILIVTGSILLMFGDCFTDTSRSRLVFSFFSATSAVCVTGLTITDISSKMTFPGQIILLVLIQLGGLGLMTISNWVFLLIRKQSTLYSVLSTSDIIGDLYLIKPADLIKRVIAFTFASEFLGASILFIRFLGDFPLGKSLWLAIFHSISAFCNAGFSLFSNSLVNYHADFTVNITIISLIILGGLGFVVVIDVSEWWKGYITRKPRHLSLHSQIVLTVTVVLIVSASILFFVFEFKNPEIKGSIPVKFMEAVFLSVTARTAGFNTVPTEHLTNMSLVVLIFIMVIGASPGSTGGGIKTTSIAVIIAQLKAHLINRPKAEIFSRTVPTRFVARALGVIILYLLTAILALIVLQATEFGGIPHYLSRGVFMEHVFEVVSALSTVGLSTGITAHLSDIGLTVLMICMFIGRVGPLVLIMSLLGEWKKLPHTFPESNVIIG